MQYSEQEVQKLLQEQRQRMAKEIEGKKQKRNNISHPSYWEDMEEFGKIHFNSGLQAALNIVLGEEELK